MPKMTEKYKTALETAKDLGFCSVENPTGDVLYSFLQGRDYFWNPKDKVWRKGQEPDDPTPYLQIRVWSHIDEVESHAVKIIDLFKKNGYKLPEKSAVYACRPPKQLEGRIYLKFLPEDWQN